MTLLYYNPIFLEHQTGRHPERPERLIHVMRHLERSGLDVRCQRPQWQQASNELLASLHSNDYVAQLERFAWAGGGRIEEDTVLSARSVEVARYAAGAVCDAVARVLA